ncbi:hypothetical protein A4S05_35695 [Nostoc sp. KVJ20]|nr:hypothetical protein A4S05_35695 [Nostoc sp. KVJ20]
MGHGKEFFSLLPLAGAFSGQCPMPNSQCPLDHKEKISKFNLRKGLVAKKLGDATRSHQFTRLQTIPSIVTLFKTFSFLLGDGYPT